MYCGETFTLKNLSRDHVIPLSKGGEDKWTNLVTACKGCNNKKGDRTPEQAGMPLLAVPFIPSRVEYLILRGRTILADQMDFLLSHVPKTSRIRKRYTKG
jgi:5-methylcytosine-specific restriction endonuclease McrA